MVYKLARSPPSSPKKSSLRPHKEEFTLGLMSPSPSSHPSPASSRNSTIGRSSIQTTTSSAPSSLPPSPMKNEKAALVSTVEAGEEEKERYPTAILDVERISDVMAARLATCLLGHVLYLKSQIPFPISQLLRMSLTRRSDPRTAKRHDALLSSFDVLSSHLGSTFTALSTALAIGRRRRSHSALEVDYKPHRTGENYTPLQTWHGFMTPEEKIHIAFVIGPSVTSASAARARVVLEICGLEIKALGEGADLPQKSQMSIDRRAGGVLADISGGECRTDEKEVDDSSDYDLESVGESVPDSASSDFVSDEADDQEEDKYCVTDTEEVLRTAERLLSRTLAIANADPELGMAAELQPSQTHILLRAPRRFIHPSWIPRQALSRDMDQFLSAFDKSYSKPTYSNTKKTTRFKVKTECVRVRCNSSVETAEDKDEDNEDEEGQLIWWSWDGKLEGFSDF